LYFIKFSYQLCESLHGNTKIYSPVGNLAERAKKYKQEGLTAVAIA